MVHSSNYFVNLVPFARRGMRCSCIVVASFHSTRVAYSRRIDNCCKKRGLRNASEQHYQEAILCQRLACIGLFLAFSRTRGMNVNGVSVTLCLYVESYLPADPNHNSVSQWIFCPRSHTHTSDSLRSLPCCLDSFREDCIA